MDMQKKQKNRALMLYCILEIMFDISYLFFCFLGQNPEPVSNHAQDRSEIRQTHQNPEPDQGLVPFHVFYFSITT